MRVFLVFGINASTQAYKPTVCPTMPHAVLSFLCKLVAVMKSSPVSLRMSVPRVKHQIVEVYFVVVTLLLIILLLDRSLILPSSTCICNLALCSFSSSSLRLPYGHTILYWNVY